MISETKDPSGKVVSDPLAAPYYDPWVGLRDGIPVLRAERTDQGVRVWCKYCVSRRSPWPGSWHYHGQGYGHRAAHCRTDLSPYRLYGYILIPVDQEQAA